MWQQMLILIMLGWIVDVGVSSAVTVSPTKMDISSVLPSTENDSVDSVDITGEGSVPEKEQIDFTENENVTESRKPTNSSEKFEKPHESESNSPVQLNYTLSGSKTESSAASVGKDDVIKENEVSNSSREIKESNNEGTVPVASHDMEIDSFHDKDSVPNITDGQSDESDNQEEEENNVRQSFRNKGAQTSNSTSENGLRNTSKVVSDSKASSAPESSRSDSVVTPPPNPTSHSEVKHTELSKNITSTSTSTTTVAAKVNNEGSVESPFQVMDEINTGETGSQSSEMNEVPASDENYDKVDLLGGKEDFGEKTIIDNGGKFSDDEDSHFFAYFLTIMVTAIIFYLIFHNKQRIIALIIEGRAPSNRGRRLSRKVRYHKLDNNLEEAITATKGAKYDRIY